MEKSIKKKRSGQSLVEMVVAVAISSLVLVGLLSGSIIGLRNVQSSRNQSQAMELCREASEWLRSEKEISWSRLWAKGSSLGKTYCLKSLDFFSNRACSLPQDQINGQFYRQAVLTQSGADADKLEIVITTSWQDSVGNHTETITTYLTKY
jgi:type II secretory pathway pseudopilin PulG